MTKAIFLDRDGTLNVDVGYLHQLKDLELFPWTVDALRLLKRAGYELVIVTNQSGLAQGLIQPGFVEECHDEMRRRLQAGGTDLDALYYCPHHPEGSAPEYSITCKCRKPSPGMLLEAEKNHQLDLSASWIIGDKASDIEAGINAGCKTILVRTGYGDKINSESLPAGTIIKNDLLEAVNFILLSKSPLVCCA